MPIQLTVKARGAQLVRQGLEDLTREVPRIGRARIWDKLKEVMAKLRTPGTAISYPVNWDSERQRRYVIAMLRSRGDLPYSRRGVGGMADTWSIERAGELGYQLTNSNDAAVYLYGNYEGARQSRIHQGRWPVFQQEVESAIQELPPDIEQHISYYGRQKLG